MFSASCHQGRVPARQQQLHLMCRNSVPQMRPTHPREQILEQNFLVLWLPVVERHQGIHKAMLQHMQRVLEGEHYASRCEAAGNL